MINTELKPMDLGQIFEKTFKLAFSNMKKYFKLWLAYIGIIIGLSIIIAIIIGAAIFINSSGFSNIYSENFTNNLPLFLIIIIPTSIIGFILLTVIAVFYYGIVYDIMIKGFLNEEWTLKESIIRIKNKFWSIIGAGFLSFFIIIGGYLMCCIGVIPMGALIVCVLSCLLFENIGPATAISRSFKLASYSFWPFLGTTLLFSIMIGFILGIAQAPFQILSLFMRGGSSMMSFEGNNMTLIIVLAVISYIFYLSVYMIITVVNISFYVVMYFNQKIKYESFGLETMADTLVQEIKTDDKPQV